MLKYATYADNDNVNENDNVNVNVNVTVNEKIFRKIIEIFVENSFKKLKKPSKIKGFTMFKQVCKEC